MTKFAPAPPADLRGACAPGVFNYFWLTTRHYILQLYSIHVKPEMYTTGVRTSHCHCGVLDNLIMDTFKFV